ncbi:MAG: aldolase/citrate lyase family protein, partial [Paracoccaceae bacterium]
MLQALDSGATGIVVPHVRNVEIARDIARSARFGADGRGFNGGTRWAGYDSQNMAELIARSARETIVIVQIEEVEGVSAAADIAAVAGIDALFIGPADLSISYGKTDTSSSQLKAAYESVGQAARAHGKGFVSYASDAQNAAALRRHGVHMFVVASEQRWMAEGARAVANGVQGLRDPA